jgi:hypothetical protein
MNHHTSVEQQIDDATVQRYFNGAEVTCPQLTCPPKRSPVIMLEKRNQ